MRIMTTAVIDDVLDVPGKTNEAGRSIAESPLGAFQPALILKHVSGLARVNMPPLRNCARNMPVLTGMVAACTQAVGLCMKNVADEVFLIVCADLKKLRGKNPALSLGVRRRPDNLCDGVDGSKRRQDHCDR